MDAYDQHVKFCKETGVHVSQSDFVNAFQQEYGAELDRAKYNGTVKRETWKVRSSVSETVYNRFLNWYDCKDNPLITATPKTFKQTLYNLIAHCRYAAVFCYILKYNHDDMKYFKNMSKAFQKHITNCVQCKEAAIPDCLCYFGNQLYLTSEQDNKE